MVQNLKLSEIMEAIEQKNPRMGEIKKIAATIKKDHQIALDLWRDGRFGSRLLAVLAFDKTKLTEQDVEQLARDLSDMESAERDKISEWLMAHQLMKSKKLTSFLEQCMEHELPTLRRLFWYHQGRLRWTGQTPPANTQMLVSAIKERLATEEPEVQWAMNFAAGWIGVHDKQYRTELTKLGQKIALYEGDHVSPGCTPNYLPLFIKIEAEKRGL